MTFKFNRVRAVRGKFHQAECSGSWDIVYTSSSALSRNAKESKNAVLWPWPLTNDLEILWVSSGCQDARSCKISPSWVQRFESYGANRESRTKTIRSVATARTVKTAVKQEWKTTSLNVNERSTSEMNGRKSSQNGWLTSSELATRPRTDKLFSVLCPPSCTRDTWYMQRRMGIFF